MSNISTPAAMNDTRTQTMMASGTSTKRTTSTTVTVSSLSSVSAAQQKQALPAITPPFEELIVWNVGGVETTATMSTLTTTTTSILTSDPVKMDDSAMDASVPNQTLSAVTTSTRTTHTTTSISIFTSVSIEMQVDASTDDQKQALPKVTTTPTTLSSLLSVPVTEADASTTTAATDQKQKQTLGKVDGTSSWASAVEPW